MDFTFVTDLLSTVAGWMKPYLSEIGLSMAATLLVIYGDNIMSAFKKQIGAMQFFLKITLFVLFCAFGFAFITSFVTPVVVNALREINDVWLPVAVIGGFYLIGLGAQKKGMI